MVLASLHERMVRAVFFPVSQCLFNRRKIMSEFRSSRKTESLPQETIASLQMQKLRVVLEKAVQFVPFYRHRFQQAGITIGAIRDPDDLCTIPPLSRDDLINNTGDLVDSRYQSAVAGIRSGKAGPGEPKLFSRFYKYPIVKNTSSGSTGAPTVFYENGSVSAMSWANELRVKRWFGVQPGAREARLVRVSPDFVKKSRANLVRRVLWNQMVLPGVNLSDVEYASIADQLKWFNPKVIWAFTSAATGLSRWTKEANIAPFHPSPKLVITWAAPLFQNDLEMIRDAFGCAVTNIYGMREVGHIAALCPSNSLHVFQDSHFLETDKNGELLVTFLRPTPMPFIRYRTGDIGKVATCKCACGRTLQIITEFHGRTGELFTTNDGRMFSPNFWCRTFMDAQLAATVKRFQIVYTKSGAIKVRMILPEVHRPDAEKALGAVVAKNFGPETKVMFEYPGEIAPQLSGKYQMVINENLTPVSLNGTTPLPPGEGNHFK
jgi:phenylacetate-CoA ligase